MVERGRLLLGALVRYGHYLEEYRDKIDRLNVFPVPDGDTGTNMYFTVRAATAVIEDAAMLSRLGELKRGDFTSVAKAALLGARGNSGVILCQVVASFCEILGVDSISEASLGDLAEAFELSDRRARGAVLTPVEGTILTVISDVAALAREMACAKVALLEASQALLDRAEASLERTPELLPQLRKAGVVDSGGAGLVLFVAALGDVLGANRSGAQSELHFGFESVVPEARGLVVGELRPSATSVEIGPRYEVMFILESNAASVNAFREVWAGLGDSIVIVGQDDTYNCHIHTDDIGASIEAGVEAGTPSRIRVTDLAEQVLEERWVLEAKGAGAPDPYVSEAAIPPETSVVVVANGEGVSRIFRSLGVGRIVVGGQSMNPSTEEILAAIEDVPASNVVVLPNNTNVTPVAQIAAHLSGKKVKVIPTRGIVEGLSALVEFDPMVDIEENVARMTECAKRVAVAEITRAVRDYHSEVGEVTAGQFIGLGRDGVVSISDCASGAAIGALQAMLPAGAEIVTIIEGDGSTASATREITEWLSESHAEIEVEIHHGAQPLYPYLLGIE